MLEGERKYLAVRVCPGCCPLGDALLGPLSFLRTDVSGEAAIEVWLLLLTGAAEHLEDTEKATLFLPCVLSLWETHLFLACTMGFGEICVHSLTPGVAV